MNPWSLLRRQEASEEEGLNIIQKRYAQNPIPSHFMELGIAFLWLGRYESAWEHFHSETLRDPKSGDGFFGMAGVAKWCLGKPLEAVAEWQSGLSAKYARAGGLGIRMPMLLYFASVTNPNLYPTSQAELLLREKTMNARIKTWPGPIAKLLLDQISEIDFITECNKSRDRTRTRPWLAEFYKATLQFSSLGTLAFQKIMERLSDTSQPEWGDHDVFITRIWNEEFFLARCEAIK